MLPMNVPDTDAAKFAQPIKPIAIQAITIFLMALKSFVQSIQGVILHTYWDVSPHRVHLVYT